MKKPKIKSITIIGKLWNGNIYGNTYHTAIVLVNGEFIGKTIYSYGYGSQYEQSAIDLLQKQGYLKDYKEPCCFWRYCEGHNIKHVSTSSYVSRKKDL